MTEGESPYIWTSELNECEVYSRAQAFNGELYSHWFEVGPILIDNNPQSIFIEIDNPSQYYNGNLPPFSISRIIIKS